MRTLCETFAKRQQALVQKKEKQQPGLGFHTTCDTAGQHNQA